MHNTVTKINEELN